MILTLVLLGCFAVAQSAPVEQAAAQVVSSTDEMTGMQAIDTRQSQEVAKKYLIFSPDVQQQFQPIGKMQKPVFQPLALFGSGKTTGKLQQFCNQMQSGGVGGLPDDFLGNLFVLDNFDDDDEDDDEQVVDNNEKPAKQIIPEINTDAEPIPEGIIPQGNAPQTPRVDVPVVREHRFYTIAGPPQFFGNVDILQDPLHPIFSIQPLQAIRMKSTSESKTDTHSNEIPTSVLQSSEKENRAGIDKNSQHEQAFKKVDPRDQEKLATNDDAIESFENNDKKEERKNKPKTTEWGNFGPVTSKSIESTESKETTDDSSENLAKSSANRLNVNWMQRNSALVLADEKVDVMEK